MGTIHCIYISNYVGVWGEEVRPYMNRVSACPPKPEKANRNTEGTHAGGRQELLRLDLTLLIKLRLLNVVEVQKELVE